jgi:hypothetical protein
LALRRAEGADARRGGSENVNAIPEGGQ